MIIFAAAVTSRSPPGGSREHTWEAIASLPDIDNEPAETVASELAHRALTLIQSEFETSTWQAFWAMAVEGSPAADVAQDLGLTVAAVYKAKSRVLHRYGMNLKAGSRH